MHLAALHRHGLPGTVCNLLGRHKLASRRVLHSKQAVLHKRQHLLKPDLIGEGGVSDRRQVGREQRPRILHAPSGRRTSV